MVHCVDSKVCRSRCNDRLSSPCLTTLIGIILRRNYLPPRLQWYQLLVAPLLKIPLTPELIVSFGIQ
jgi:hypothetical protein